MIENKKRNEINNSEAVFSPLVEIVHFDKFNKQNKKETIPVSYYLDAQCRNLKKLDNYLN